MNFVDASAPAETPVRGADRWSPATWGACLSLVTCFPALLLFLGAGSGDGRGAHLAIFCLYPTTLLLRFIPGNAVLWAVLGGQFLLYGILLLLPTSRRARRRAWFVLLGVHLALVAACFLAAGIGK
ncbi:hypothetical protein LBMAG55_02990 [Verrucomicrobiota bacterium]|nr:hypothetical protein EMGBD4_12030 [Verrucomicrobiota bacterium]GDY16976.1 hypothetical protein LBMAG55_02990 [Verrucomicrobiota bacterium]